MGIRFTQLDVWKKAQQAVLEVYRTTRTFPADERFVLGSQMRRAAISIPANIAEGCARRGPADKRHLYGIARSSAEELRYYFILCSDLGYVKPELAQYREDQICRMLYGMIEAMDLKLR